MNRLPSYDLHTSRTERSLFLSLSLAAAALIGVAGIDAWRFAGMSEERFVTGSTGTATVIQSSTERANPTNLTSFQPASPTERARATGLSLPKS